jgi:hypothetical protein
MLLIFTCEMLEQKKYFLGRAKILLEQARIKYFKNTSEIARVVKMAQISKKKLKLI